MSKKRRFHRQSATNPAQIKATGTTGPIRNIPVVLDHGDGREETVMVSEAEFAALQRRGRARTIKAEAEDGKEVTLSVAGNAPAGNIYADEEVTADTDQALTFEELTDAMDKISTPTQVEDVPLTVDPDEYPVR